MTLDQRTVVCMFLFAFLVTGAFAQNPNLGTSGAKFLRIPTGARAAALGGAAVAGIDDASAVFWNPAGIVGVGTTEVLTSFNPWWASVQINSAALVTSLGDDGALGLSLTVLSMGSMEVTTETQPEGTGELFDAGDLMVGLTYARKLTPDFSVGVTAKYINQRIWHESADGWSVDIGTRYRIGYRDLTIGMSMTNFGPDLAFDGRDLEVTYDKNGNIPDNRLTPARMKPEEYPLPLHFQVGLSMTAFKADGLSVLVAVDVAHPNDNVERVNTGTEITILDQFRLRGGYRFGYDLEGATLGAGVAVPAGSVQLSFDYAFSVYDLLPSVHRVSLSMAF